MHFMKMNDINERRQIQYILAIICIESMKVPKYLDLFKCEKFRYSSDFILIFISVVFIFCQLKSLKSCLKSWLLWIRNFEKKPYKLKSCLFLFTL